MKITENYKSTVSSNFVEGKANQFYKIILLWWNIAGSYYYRLWLFLVIVILFI